MILVAQLLAGQASKSHIMVPLVECFVEAHRSLCTETNNAEAAGHAVLSRVTIGQHH